MMDCVDIEVSVWYFWQSYRTGGWDGNWHLRQTHYIDM